MIAKLLTEHHLEFLSLKGDCRGSSESTLVKCHIFGNHMHWLELVHEISNNVVCATSKALDQPAHKCSLIRAIDSRLSIL